MLPESMELSITRAYLIRLCLALLLLPSLFSAEQVRNAKPAQSTSEIGQAADFQLPSFYSLRVQDVSSALSNSVDFPVLPILALLLVALVPKSTQIAFLYQAHKHAACRVFAARAPPIIA
ncbi:MAG: hypothetical protein RL217_2091 [Pseudomonadota bacterium]|jgi:hypothetical protein